MKSEVYSQSTCIVSTVAYQYYIEGKKRSEISKSLGLSSSTISRLLKRAKEEGVIEFRITEPYLSCNKMEEAIVKKYGLKSVLIVPVPEGMAGNEEEIKKQVALEGARYVQRIIKDGDVLGLAWGGTMYHLIQYLNPCRKVKANIITLHGSIASCDEKLAVESLVKRASMAFGGRCVTATAPGLYRKEEELNQIRENPACQRLYRLFNQVNISVSGVGSLFPENDSLLTKTDYLKPEEIQMIRQQEAYSDIMLRFLDKDGKECDTSLKNRTLSIDLNTYKKIPMKIIAASGEKKANSVLSLLRGGLVDVLIIDYYLAQKVLS